MELLIVRHAIAMERDAKRWPDDRKRPLSRRGIGRARRAAAGLRQLTPAPVRVLTSPLVRAQQTAQILNRYADWPRAAHCAQLTPDAPPQPLLALLNRSRGQRIAVVGHEPHLSALLAICLPGRMNPTAGFRKMGVALVKFRGRARAAGGQLVWLAAPKSLRAARRSRTS